MSSWFGSPLFFEGYDGLRWSYGGCSSFYHGGTETVKGLEKYCMPQTPVKIYSKSQSLEFDA